MIFGEGVSQYEVMMTSARVKVSVHVGLVGQWVRCSVCTCKEDMVVYGWCRLGVDWLWVVGTLTIVVGRCDHHLHSNSRPRQVPAEFSSGSAAVQPSHLLHSSYSPWNASSICTMHIMQQLKSWSGKKIYAGPSEWDI